MDKIIIGEFSLYQLWAYFFIYAFLGWITEVIFATLKTGKFINRGFLNGPVCPIYGTGLVIVLLILTPIQNNLIYLFISSLLLTTFLEFITGFIMEKFFHQKWWDYSKEPFNIKGYVCLRFAVLWGLACVFVIRLIQPLINDFINLFNIKLGLIIEICLFTIFLMDIVITIIQLVQHGKNLLLINKVTNDMRKPSDAIGKKVSKATLTVKDEYDKAFEKIKKSRLAKAFPTLISNIQNRINKDKHK